MAELLRAENVWAGYGDAVVLEDLPSRCVAVGIPARVVRRDIDPASFLYHRRQLTTQ